jgi:hypothetical protein
VPKTHSAALATVQARLCNDETQGPTLADAAIVLGA